MGYSVKHPSEEAMYLVKSFLKVDKTVVKQEGATSFGILLYNLFSKKRFNNQLAQAKANALVNVKRIRKLFEGHAYMQNYWMTVENEIKNIEKL